MLSSPVVLKCVWGGGSASLYLPRLVSCGLTVECFKVSKGAKIRNQGQLGFYEIKTTRRQKNLATCFWDNSAKDFETISTKFLFMQLLIII